MRKITCNDIEGCLGEGTFNLDKEKPTYGRAFILCSLVLSLVALTSFFGIS